MTPTVRRPPGNMPTPQPAPPCPFCEGPFDDIARAIFARAFTHQAADGGLPETLPGTQPGCWKSDEIYAAVASLGMEQLCPPGSLKRLDEWPLAVSTVHA